MNAFKQRNDIRFSIGVRGVSEDSNWWVIWMMKQGAEIGGRGG